MYGHHAHQSQKRWTAQYGSERKNFEEGGGKEEEVLKIQLWGEGSSRLGLGVAILRSKYSRFSAFLNRFLTIE